MREERKTPGWMVGRLVFGEGSVAWGRRVVEQRRPLSSEALASAICQIAENYNYVVAAMLRKRK